MSEKSAERSGIAVANSRYICYNEGYDTSAGAGGLQAVPYRAPSDKRRRKVWEKK